MTMNWKRNSKKYIAGILTIALAAGVCQSYGFMEVKAQEKTLPGIEKLVYDTVSSGDTFHILEIVPSKEDASIGYLIGGEEPVASGRKLSELPSQSERGNAIANLAANAGSDTGRCRPNRLYGMGLHRSGKRKHGRNEKAIWFYLC